MKCPFCNANLGQLFRHMKEASGLPKPGDQHGSLCTECGEPLFVTATGFRKPLPEEYGDIANHPAWQMGRLAYLEAEEQRKDPPMHGNWVRFRDDALESFLIDVVGGSSASKSVLAKFVKGIELIFNCGQISAISTAQADLNRSDSGQHLAAIFSVHRAELGALFDKLGYQVTSETPTKKGKHS